MYRHISTIGPLPDGTTCLEHMAAGFQSTSDFGPDWKFNYLLKPSPQINAAQLLEEHKKLSKEITNKMPPSILSALLLPTRITMISGEPGSGKTSLCLRLALQVQIPKEYGGIGGEVIFITTECDFPVERVYSLVAKQPKIPKIAASYLHGIFSSYVTTQNEFIAKIRSLRDFISRNPNIKLIVVDSLWRPFSSMANYPERNTIIHNIVSELQHVADHSKVCILVTSPLTTIIEENDDDGLSSRLTNILPQSICTRMAFHARLQGAEAGYEVITERTFHSKPKTYFYNPIDDVWG